MRYALEMEMLGINELGVLRNNSQKTNNIDNC